VSLKLLSNKKFRNQGLLPLSAVSKEEKVPLLSCSARQIISFEIYQIQFPKGCVCRSSRQWTIDPIQNNNHFYSKIFSVIIEAVKWKIINSLSMMLRFNTANTKCRHRTKF
jgi:hypothetical protein